MLLLALNKHHFSQALDHPDLNFEASRGWFRHVCVEVADSREYRYKVGKMIVDCVLWKYYGYGRNQVTMTEVSALLHW